LCWELQQRQTKNSEASQPHLVIVRWATSPFAPILLRVFFSDSVVEGTKREKISIFVSASTQSDYFPQKLNEIN
jgi:hypothetical protein